MKHFTAALVLLAGTLAPAQTVRAQQGGDADKGARIFKRCMACHAVGPDAGNKVGPHLNDLFGRQPGSLEGFGYSKPMRAFGEDKVWTVETLSAYLAKPRKVVKGTTMGFAGLRKPQQIADLIAYLATFDEGGTDASK